MFLEETLMFFCGMFPCCRAVFWFRRYAFWLERISTLRYLAVVIQSLWKIIPILVHRIASAVFFYIGFPASVKMFWLVTCPANSGQKQRSSSILYNNCKLQIIKGVLISTPGTRQVFFTTISKVFAHA